MPIKSLIPVFSFSDKLLLGTYIGFPPFQNCVDNFLPEVQFSLRAVVQLCLVALTHKLGSKIDLV